MNAVDWCSNTFENEKTQKLLEDKLGILLRGSLSDKNEYQKEKAIKAFSEGLGYLEKNLLYQRGIHHSQLDLVNVNRNPEDYRKKLEEVERIMETELSRQFRHWNTFL